MTDGAQLELVLGGRGAAVQANLAIGPFLRADPVEGVLRVRGGGGQDAEVAL